MSSNKNTAAASLRNTKTVSATYTILAGDDTIKVTGQSTVVNLSLPDPANPIKSERPIGRYQYQIVVGNDANNGAKLVTLSAAPGGNINGSTNGITLQPNQTYTAFWDDNANGVGVGGWIATRQTSASNGGGNVAFADGLSTVPLAPAAQTTGAAVDVMAAILTASASGFFRGAAQLAMTGTSADVLTCKVVTRTQAATILPLGNNTASGTNCQFQTAAGGLTYTGTPAAQVHLVYTVTILTGVLTAVFQWAGRLANGATQIAYPFANNVIMAIQHGNSAHTTTFSGSGAVGGANSIDLSEAA